LKAFHLDDCNSLLGVHNELSGVPQDHTDTWSSTLVGSVSLTKAVVSTASRSSSFSGMYRIGGFTQLLHCSHSWGLSPSVTALLILRFLRAILRGILPKKAL
jgi:hypothetical protein